jgi:phosphoesterase RecJ-like protein
MHDISALKNLLQTPQHIAIITHFNPDGDAMGSALGLYHYLKIQNAAHTLTVVTPSNAPNFLGFLPDSDAALSFERAPQQCTDALSNATLIFCLDFNDPARVHGLQQALELATAPKVLIDHHLHPKNFCNLFVMSQPNAAATCQLVYDFIGLMGDQQHITPNIAQCLYTGIMTDTGSFRFAGTSPEVHRTVAHLIECGADNTQIHQNIMDTNTPEKLKFLGYCLSQKMVVLPAYHTAYLTVSISELEAHNSRPYDTEGLVNYALSIAGVRLGVILIERPNEVKLSFRSKNTVPANIFAGEFEGGGHLNAAGGRSHATLDTATALFLEKLPIFAQKYMQI